MTNAARGDRHREVRRRREDHGPSDADSGRASWRVEGDRREGPAGAQGRNPYRRFSFWWVLGAMLVVNWVVATIFLNPSQPTGVPYSFFRTQVQAGNVSEVIAVGDTIDGEFKKAVAAPGSTEAKELKEFSTHRPHLADDDKLFDLLSAHGVTVSSQPPPGPSLLERVLLGFGPTLLFVGLFVLLMRRAAAGLGGLGRSRAKRHEPDRDKRVTFADVAGIDEVADEVAEIAGFLRNPRRYRRLGALRNPVPRGGQSKPSPT